MIDERNLRRNAGALRRRQGLPEPNRPQEKPKEQQTPARREEGAKRK